MSIAGKVYVWIDKKHTSVVDIIEPKQICLLAQKEIFRILVEDNMHAHTYDNKKSLCASTRSVQVDQNNVCVSFPGQTNQRQTTE